MSRPPARFPESAQTNGNRFSPPAAQTEGEPEVNVLFRMAMKHEASDLHLKAGQPPRMRVRGAFHPLEYPSLSSHDVERLTLPLLTGRQSSALAEEGAVSFTYAVGHGEGRFHVSLFLQRGNLSLAARRIPNVIPRLAQLGLPDVVEKLCDTPAGLIVLAGGPGSGKRTTVAAMLEHVNERKMLHVLTIEDSIGFDFIDKKACIDQREVGSDCRDRREALAAAVRQDPDVLFVGELRDAETVEGAIHVAEKGRLVLGTLEAAGARETIERLLGLFPAERRGVIRKALANHLKAVVAQKLVKGLKKPLIPANEIMLCNPTIKKLLEEGADDKLPDAIRLFYQDGMIDLTESLKQLHDRGEVDRATALEWAPDPEKLKMLFKGIKVSSGGLLGGPPAPARAAAPPPPPPAAPAPARPAPGQARGWQDSTPAVRREDSPPTVRRKATVRYFTRMHPHRLYRLLVVLSGQEVRKLLLNEVGQATSEGFAVRVSEPIEVEPVLPGCSVYPPRREVTVTGQEPVEARFQVMPHVEGGSVEDPAVVLRQSGRELARVSLKIKVGKPALAYALSAASVAVPLVLKFLKLHPDTQAEADFSGYRQLADAALNLPWWAWTLPLLLAAGVATWWYWPREDVFWDVDLDPPQGGPAAEPGASASKRKGKGRKGNPGSSEDAVVGQR